MPGSFRGRDVPAILREIHDENVERWSQAPASAR